MSVLYPEIALKLARSGDVMNLERLDSKPLLSNAIFMLSQNIYLRDYIAELPGVKSSHVKAGMLKATCGNI